MIVTIFESVYSNNPYYIHVDKILNRFKKEDKHDIDNLKNLSKEERDLKKVKLPVAVFGGKFTSRKSENLICASGLLVLDFDDVNVNAISEILKADKNIYAYWKSPSGVGVKSLALIDEVQKDSEYKNYYKHFQKRYSKYLDASGKDIARACFFCYDPDLYINKEAERVKIKIDEPKKVKANIDRNVNDYSVVNVPCDMIRHAVVGERHNKIRDASRLLGGYVALNKISFDEAERILRLEADNVNDDYNDNQKAIEDGLNHGIQHPIKEDEIKKKYEEQKSTIKFGKIYFTLKDKEAELNDYFETGNVRGYLTGHKEFDEYWSCRMGATTYVYGAPFAGKTQFWFEVLISLSVKNGLRHAIFSPETGDAKDIFAELVSMVAKADFTKTYKNQMTVSQRDEAYKFVDKHFLVIDPSDQIITHHDFFNYLNEIERVYNTKIHTATIDPFNEFRQELSGYSNRQDLYLEAVLTEVRQNAKINDRHNCIITHVQDQQIQIDKQTDMRFYPPATYREIAGGQAWSRKGMSMLSVWRPKEGLKDIHGEPYLSNETMVFIQKSKPKGVGKIGEVRFLYDAKTHRYSDLNGNTVDETKEEQVEQAYNKNYELFDSTKAVEQFEKAPF